MSKKVKEEVKLEEEKVEEEIKPEEEKEFKKKNNGLLIGILVTLIILLLGVILYLEKDKMTDLFNFKSNSNETKNGEKVEEEKVYNSLSLDKTDKYKYTLTAYELDYGFCYEEDSLSSLDCENKEKPIEIKVATGLAGILDTYENKYIFYKDDNKIKVYNVYTKKSYVINISNKFYAYIFCVDESDDDFAGIVYYESSNDKPSFYSVVENKTLYNRKYNNLYFLSKDYLNGTTHETIEDEDDGFEMSVMTGTYLLSAKEEKILLSSEITPDEEGNYEDQNYDIIANSKGSYIYLAALEDDELIKKIYTKELKTILVTDDYVEIDINDEGNLLVLNDNVVDVYNKNGKKIKTSEKFEDALQLIEDYVVIIENNKLKISTIDGERTEITNWNKNKYYHSGLSGWYTENGKNGIYMVVEESVSVDEVYKYCSKHDSCDGMSKKDLAEVDRGYEYFFIPETGETGKIPTYIGGYAKPILYLYPTKDMNVSVTFEKADNLTTTYPKYNNSWNMFAKTNGDLYDSNGKYYYGLYWEERLNHRVDFSEGFYVEGKDAIKFLEEKLEIIGLNERESNEFIMYWLPILEKNEHNLVYFELTSERDKYSKININPKPDSMLRMAIHVKKVNGYTKIKEEKLTRFNRTGFSAVEWGGIIY